MKTIILHLGLVLASCSWFLSVAAANETCIGAIGGAKVGYSSPSVLQQTKHEGYFPPDDPVKLAQAQARYLGQRGGSSRWDKSRIRRVDKEDLFEDFSKWDESKLGKLRRQGVKLLGTATTAHPNLGIFSGTSYNGFSPLYYETSGAGLWNRGGGTTKAVLPLNLSETLGPDRASDLAKLGLITASKESQPHDYERAANAIAGYLEQAKQHPRALNILDLKFANIALLSKEASAYIHFDVWTSEKTHKEIHSTIRWLMSHFSEKIFSPDHLLNEIIHEALRSYFLVSERLGETHVFGYQEGFYGLDPVSGKSLFNTDRIGEGAGMARPYLDRSGRTAELKRRGVDCMVFQNLEVITDIALEFEAFRRSEKPVAVVVVPEQPGYTGGHPYKYLESEDETLNVLLEDSAVPEELLLGHRYFNSNTIYQSLDLAPPTNIGYEPKKNPLPHIRLKMNAGDITHEYPSVWIGGRVWYEFEQVKDFGECVANGPKVIERLESRWMHDYLPNRHPAAVGQSTHGLIQVR
ncbi:MAG: hypothetical protein HY537_06250 [Deltaproteobacteria bacterium]|nr:hypothetical protein [Deltaproteobacteria bacterium]